MALEEYRTCCRAGCRLTIPHRHRRAQDADKEIKRRKKPSYAHVAYRVRVPAIGVRRNLRKGKSPSSAKASKEKRIRTETLKPGTKGLQQDFMKANGFQSRSCKREEWTNKASTKQKALGKTANRRDLAPTRPAPFARRSAHVRGFLVVGNTENAAS